MIDISKSPTKIAGMFDSIADRYDFLNHLLSAGIDRRWRTVAIASLGLTGRETVLDLCTGTADLAIAAATQAAGAKRVVGVDFAAAMLRVAAEKLRRLHLTSHVALVRGDATRIPLADRSVDAVTVAFGIRNVEDTAAACKELYRVLGPGGRAAILEFSIPTAPVIRQAYLWYFRRVLPLIGRAISRHNAAYGYLPASVSAFATPTEFVDLLRAAGFSTVAATPLTFGVVTLFVARR